VDCELWVVEKRATALRERQFGRCDENGRVGVLPTCVVVFCGGAGNLELWRGARRRVWLSYEGDERPVDSKQVGRDGEHIGLAKDCDLNGGSRNLSAMSRTSSGSGGQLHEQ